jgi:hypothetical protein
LTTSGTAPDSLKPTVSSPTEDYDTVMLMPHSGIKVNGFMHLRLAMYMYK